MLDERTVLALTLHRQLPTTSRWKARELRPQTGQVWFVQTDACYEETDGKVFAGIGAVVFRLMVPTSNIFPSVSVKRWWSFWTLSAARRPSSNASFLRWHVRSCCGATSVLQYCILTIMRWEMHLSLATHATAWLETFGGISCFRIQQRDMSMVYTGANWL